MFCLFCDIDFYSYIFVICQSVMENQRYRNTVGEKTDNVGLVDNGMILDVDVEDVLAQAKISARPSSGTELKMSQYSDLSLSGYHFTNFQRSFP